MFSKVKENNGKETKQESEKLQALMFDSGVKLVLQSWPEQLGTRRICMTNNRERHLGKSHICIQNPEDLQKPNGQNKVSKTANWRYQAQGEPDSEANCILIRNFLDISYDERTLNEEARK